MEDKLKERGGAVPHQLRVGVQLQSGGVRIPMQCPNTAKPPDGVSERKTGQTERKKKGKTRNAKRQAKGKPIKRWERSEEERQREEEGVRVNLRNVSVPVKRQRGDRSEIIKYIYQVKG